MEDTPVVVTFGSARPAGYERGEIDEQLKRELKAGRDKLVVEGLEPGDGLETLTARAVELGFRSVRIETSGVGFADRAVAAGIARAGATEICVTLPASDARTYGKITGDPSGFASCVEGLRNAASIRGVAASASVPVRAENENELEKIMDLATDAGARSVILDASSARDNVARETRSRMLACIERAVRYGASKGISISLKGSRTHHVAPFADGRLDKGAKEDACLLTYYRPGRLKRRRIFSADFRMTYKCNQRCTFCGADAISDEPDPSRTRARLRELLRNNISRLCFEGGEPTLVEELPEYLKMAKRAGVREVTLMTNGTRAADGEFAKRIVEAGANRIFVSLHAHKAELSDEITRSPGGFARTVKGIRNFMQSDAAVYLIFVALSKNIAILPDYVEFTGREFQGVPILLSVVTPYLSPSLDAKLIPRYADIEAALLKALPVARSSGVVVSGMEEQHRPPDCVMRETRRIFRNLFAPLDRRAQADGFVKAPQCADCARGALCPGVKEFYARAHGASELSPFR